VGEISHFAILVKNGKEGGKMNKVSRFACYFTALIFLMTVFGSFMPVGAEEDPQPMEDLSHTVFSEELTGTWCQYCPAAAEQLNNIYASGDYSFYFIALIEDKVQKANDRCTGDYNVGGYPTVHFDGGYESTVGGGDNEQNYRDAIESCGARAVPDIDVTVTAYNMGGSSLDVTVSITNNDGAEYTGYLRTYISEIISRYINYDGDPYHFGFLDYAFDEAVTISAGDTWENTVTWVGSDVTDLDGNDFGDIDPANIMIFATVFNDEANPKVQPDIFVAYYADETAATLVTPPPNYGISFTPPTQQQTVGAGEVAQYIFTLQNTGDADDTYDLVKSGTNSDWGTVSESSISLGAGLSQDITMQVDVPPGTGDGNYAIDVTATSQGDSSKTQTASTTTIVSSVVVYGVELYSEITSKTAFPGDSAIYTINVKNTGNTADDIDMTKTEFNSDWGTLSKSMVSLAGGGSEDITLKVNVPSDANSGSYLIKVKGTSSNDASKNYELSFSTVVEELTYGIELSPDTQDGTVETGNDIYFTITAENTGNTQDIIDLLVSGEFDGWADLSQSALDLDAGEEQNVILTISVPASASAGDYDFSVSGESQGDSIAYDEVSVSITVTEPPEGGGEPIAFSNLAHSPTNPTSEDDITVTATVTGDGIEKVTLYICKKELCFKTVPMTTTGSDGYTGTFDALEAGYYHYHIGVKHSGSDQPDLSDDVYFTVLDDAEGDVDTDGDGINDPNDDFPNDPAASEDTDDDGYPDGWNTGKSKDDSTTSLELDAYPNDATRWAADKEGETGWLEEQNNQYMIMFFVTIVIISLLALVAMSRRKKVQEQMPAAVAMPIQPVGVQTVAMGVPMAAEPVVSSFEPVQPATEDISCPSCGTVFDLPLAPRPLQVQCPSCAMKGMIN
jgi:hypothetical protein